MDSWRRATYQEKEQLKPFMSRRLRHKGIYPLEIYVIDDEREIILSAMCYELENKWSVIAIRRYHPAVDFEESWSNMAELVRPLVDVTHTLIEVYPPVEKVINTAPTRWFWIVPVYFDTSLFDLNN